MWSSSVIQHIFRFIALVFFQVMMLNKMEFGIYAFPVIYPLFVLLLPVDMNRFTTILLALLMGLVIDILSNTYGLHASSLLFLAFVRRPVLKFMERREGYEPNTQPGLHLGTIWFISYTGILIIIHHFWFFILEIFRFDMIDFIIIKSIISSLLSLMVILIIMLLFRKVRSK